MLRTRSCYIEVIRLTYEVSGEIEEFLAVEDTRNNIIIEFLRIHSIIPQDCCKEIRVSRNSIVTLRALCQLNGYLLKVQLTIIKLHYFKQLIQSSIHLKHVL